MKSGKVLFSAAGKIVLIIIWAAFIVWCIIRRDDISIEAILNYTPSNKFFAAFLMFLLFALKSLSFVLYCAVLYVTCGILFNLPAAIILNIFGTAIMVTIPYIIGRKAGSGAADGITEKYPKAARIKEFRKENDFFFTLIVRLIGIIPCDAVSMYMGAVGVDYIKYLAGSILGMLPSIVILPVIGTSVNDITSPKFVISVCAKVLFAFLSLLISFYFRKKHSSKKI